MLLLVLVLSACTAAAHAKKHRLRDYPWNLNLEPKPILLSSTQTTTTEALLQIWPLGRIPYVDDPALVEDEDQAVALNNARMDLQIRTCIKFVKRRNEQDYVFFTDLGVDVECWNMFERNKGHVVVNAGPACLAPMRWPYKPKQVFSECDIEYVNHLYKCPRRRKLSPICPAGHTIMSLPEPWYAKNDRAPEPTPRPYTLITAAAATRSRTRHHTSTTTVTITTTAVAPYASIADQLANTPPSAAVPPPPPVVVYASETSLATTTPSTTTTTTTTTTPNTTTTTTTIPTTMTTTESTTTTTTTTTLPTTTTTKTTTIRTTTPPADDAISSSTEFPDFTDEEDVVVKMHATKTYITKHHHNANHKENTRPHHPSPSTSPSHAVAGHTYESNGSHSTSSSAAAAASSSSHHPSPPPPPHQTRGSIKAPKGTIYVRVRPEQLSTLSSSPTSSPSPLDLNITTSTIAIVTSYVGSCGSPCNYTGELLPLRRSYNDKAGVTDHFYTSDKQEQTVKIKDGYLLQAPMGFVGQSAVDPRCTCLKPLYRLYNDFLKDHLLTTLEHEKEIAERMLGYKFEKALGFCTKEPGCGAYTPLYRFYNAIAKDHLYTIDELEMTYYKTHPEHGYNLEYVECYVWSAESSERACPLNDLLANAADIGFKEWYD